MIDVGRDDLKVRLLITAGASVCSNMELSCSNETSDKKKNEQILFRIYSDDTCAYMAKCKVKDDTDAPVSQMTHCVNGKTSGGSIKKISTDKHVPVSQSRRLGYTVKTKYAKEKGQHEQ